jgi:drug/metabolite transporter (DMT)-like permease
MIVIALLTGIGSLLNYFCWANYELSSELRMASLIVQIAMMSITVIAAIRYRGKRVRKSYDGAGYKIFTVLFALMVLSLLGNVSVLMMLYLHMTGVIQSL